MESASATGNMWVRGNAVAKNVAGRVKYGIVTWRAGGACVWLSSQPRLVMGVILFGVLLIIASSLVISAVDSHCFVNAEAGYSAEDAAQYSDSYTSGKLFTILPAAFMGLFAVGVRYRYMCQHT